MTLKEGTIGEIYLVINLLMEEHIMRRLEVLGINDGTKIEVLEKKRDGSAIIKVRGTRLAIGQRITCGIEVKGIDNHEAN